MVETFLNSYFFLRKQFAYKSSVLWDFFVEAQFVFILLIFLRRSSYFRALSFFFDLQFWILVRKVKPFVKWQQAWFHLEKSQLLPVPNFYCTFPKENTWFHQWSWIIVVNTRWYLKNKIDHLSLKKRLKLKDSVIQEIVIQKIVIQENVIQYIVTEQNVI